ncbi:MAG: AraC family transcriptional regulator, partial [Flavobacteriaceae bacterium]
MRRTIVVLVLILWYGNTYPIPPIGITGSATAAHLFSPQISTTQADKFYQDQSYSRALEAYEVALKDPSVDSAYVYKKMALCEAALGNAKEAAYHAESYLMKDFKPIFLFDDGFAEVQEYPEFQSVIEAYTPKISVWSFAYLYVALIGFYIALIINFNKKIDWIARLLISGFVFIHSFFIFHISLGITNYQYEYPHSYLMSTCFSFLYGPLLYFYFKRITEQYQFKKIDLLHLIPTVLFLIYIIPIYAMSGTEKMDLMLHRVSEGLNPGDSAYIGTIVALKLASLAIYGYFIRKVYLKSKKNNDLRVNNKTWQRNIYIIHFSYILSYAVYGALISNHINTGFFYHAQIVCMALMVIYVGYSANVQPNLFSGMYSYDNQLLFKYKKSGLTNSLSEELKQQLIRLFDEDKIYKDSDINLETLAAKLNTTRHNASQVINEHFKVSFHELINKYRIQEAKKILDEDHQ